MADAEYEGDGQEVEAHQADFDAGTIDEPPPVDAFLIDDPESSSSSPSSTPTPTPLFKDTPLPSSTSIDIPLTSTTSTTQLVPVPPIPEHVSPAPLTASSSASTEDDDDAPEIYLPALISPTLFLPIPNSDPLSTLLAKHISDPAARPPRDITGDWQNADFHSLVMTNSWRALARMARDRIVASNPESIELILDLWYLRLSSLARLRLLNQTVAEMHNLFSVLTSPSLPAHQQTYLLTQLLPFELEVLRARCIYWSAGPSLGEGGGEGGGKSICVEYVDELMALLKRCRKRAKAARKEDERAMWEERAARVTLIIASHFVEVREYTSATSLLMSLLRASPTPSLRSAIARILLQSGELTLAMEQFKIVDDDPTVDAKVKDMNKAILCAAEGAWEGVTTYAKRETINERDDIVAANNLAVGLLCQGKLKEAIHILEAALAASPSAVACAEPVLFNLATLYELRAGLSTQKKRDLLLEVAKWSGDGLRASCLKMGS